MKEYIFFKGDEFYTLQLINDKAARQNAECNKGTLEVQDCMGNQVWAIENRKKIINCNLGCSICSYVEFEEPCKKTNCPDFKYGVNDIL